MRRLAPPPRLAQQAAPSPTSVPQVNHYHSSSSEKLIPAIPGFRTSAAFLTSLSANLRIDPDLPSPLLTPNFRGGNPNGFPLPPPSPLHFSTSAQGLHNPYPSPAEPGLLSPTSVLNSAYPSVEPKTPTTPNAPELRTYVAETDNDRAAALRLVTDSVAQQRQQASKSLLFHPLNLGAYVLTVALFVRSLWATNDDLPLLITVLFALTATCLVVIRYASSHYTTFAEHIDWDWLGEDRCIVVKWGGEIIGALVLGWADNSEGAKKRGTRRRRGKAVVRAWTVRGKYRGKGVGKALLEEAVRVAGERGADGILFERDHANSKRILPGIYNGYLNNQEAKAEKALEKVADEKGNFRQRRSSPTWGSR